MASNRLDTLQAGRAFAALAVLLFHTDVTLALPKYLGQHIFPIFDAGDSGVAFFFVLSGFVILFAHEKDLGRPEMLPSFLWKRFRRVYPPLWIVLLILLPVYFVVPSFGRGADTTHASTIISSFLISPVENEYLLIPEWTLRHEVIFYILFGLAIWKPKLGIVGISAWLVLSIINPMVKFTYPASFFFSSYNLLFAFGMIASMVFSRRLNKWPATLLAVGCTIFALAWAAICLNITGRSDWVNWIFGLGATCVILGAADLERARGLHVPRILTFLGEASYSIYLIHFSAVSVATKVVVELHNRMHLPETFMFIITAASGLTAGIAFHLLAERPVTRWLSGKRAVRIPQTSVVASGHES